MHGASTERRIVDLILASLRARALHARVDLDRTTAGTWLAVCVVAVARDIHPQDPRPPDLVRAQRELEQLLASHLVGASIAVSWQFEESPAELVDPRALVVAAARLRATIAARKAESERRSSASADFGAGDTADTDADADNHREHRVPFGLVWLARDHDAEDGGAAFTPVDYSQTRGVGGAAE